jgi:hypothetical protein
MQAMLINTINSCSLSYSQPLLRFQISKLEASQQPTSLFLGLFYLGNILTTSDHDLAGILAVRDTYLR